MLVRRARLEPSTLITYISRAPPTSLWKAILVPSGDHFGRAASRILSRCGPSPSPGLPGRRRCWIFDTNAPQADFTYDLTTGDAALIVQFTDASTGTDSCLWNFGDGATSTLRQFGRPPITHNATGCLPVQRARWNYTIHELAEGPEVENLLEARTRATIPTAEEMEEKQNHEWVVAVLAQLDHHGYMPRSYVRQLHYRLYTAGSSAISAQADLWKIHCRQLCLPAGL